MPKVRKQKKRKDGIRWNKSISVSDEENSDLPKTYVLSAENNGCLAGKALNSNRSMGDLQRLSPWGRVKPQANGGRKILPLLFAGWRYSLRWRESVRGLLATARLRWELRFNVNKINIYKFDSFTQMPYDISAISYVRRWMLWNWWA